MRGAAGAGSCGRRRCAGIAGCGCDLAEGPLRHRADLLGVDVAGDHQRRVVRRIKALVERQRVFAVELLDFLVPADHRAAIGMIEIQRRHDLLGQPRVRIVGDPHVEFFEHDVALRQHVLVLENQAGHAIGLELHHLGQLLARHALEIAGVVGGGEGVLVAADPEHGLGEFADRMLGGALEHQMFEKVRQAGFARGLVGGADLVPDHLGDDRGAVIRDHHNMQAVGKGKGGGPRGGYGGLGANAGHGKGGGRKQRGEESNGKAM